MRQVFHPSPTKSHEHSEITNKLNGQYCNAWYMMTVPSVNSHQNKNHIACSHHVVIFQCKKMAGEEVSFRQHAVIKFPKKEFPTLVMHTQIQCAYGATHIDASSVRWWVKHFQEGNTDIADHPHNCHQPTASPYRNKGKINELPERINVWQSGNGSRDWNREQCSPGDCGKFGMLEILCLKISSIADKRV